MAFHISKMLLVCIQGVVGKVCAVISKVLLTFHISKVLLAYHKSKVLLVTSAGGL